MKKKFKVRVKHFYRDVYTVDYCYYRFFPRWRSLLFWFDVGHPSSELECWSTQLWDYRTAEHIASTLKTINDVRAYYKPMEKEEADFWATEKEYLKTHVPYQSKIIKS